MKRREPSRKIHVSWFLAALAWGLLAGIALASVWRPEWSGVHFGLIGIVLLLPALAFRRRYLIVAVIAAGCVFGLWRGGIAQDGLQAYTPYYGASVQLRGVVAEDPTVDGNGEQRVRLRDIRIADERLPNEVWLSIRNAPSIKRSDIILVDGIMQEGFGTLPAVLRQAKVREIERPRYGDVARDVRDWFADGVRRAVAEPSASLGIGFLLGQKNVLPEHITERLRLLGLTHIIVASGYNLTILVRFARAAFARFSKYLAALAAAGMIIGFLLITGASPSMSRAALVAGLSLLAWYFGRSIHPLVLLPLAAAVTAGLQPSFVWGDLGWYLSFLAFVGVMVLAPLLQHYFWGLHHPPGAIRRIVIETMSAQIMTLPLIIYMFGQFSWLSLPANIVILPLIPLTMLLTFFGGIIGVAWPAIAVIAGWPASLMLTYMLAASGWLADKTWATVEVAVGLPFLIGGYGLLVLLLIFLAWRTKHNFRKDSIIE